MVLSQSKSLSATANYERLLRARYGWSAETGIPQAFTRALEGQPQLAHLEVLLDHRSLRSYRSTPLPEGTLETMVAAAQSAATSSNLQTWSVVAIRDPDRKARLAELAGGQAHISQCPLYLVWLADLARLSSLGDHLGLPHAALDYLEMFLTSAVDATLAAQNAVVAAEGLGLSTVYIGSMRNQPEAVAEVLGLPPHVFAVFGLCVGYADQEAAIKPRLPQSVVLHHEQYETGSQLEGIEAYNQTMREFYRDQAMQVDVDWAEHSLNRVAQPESLSGRDRLPKALKALGFPIL